MLFVAIESTIYLPDSQSIKCNINFCNDFLYTNVMNSIYTIRDSGVTEHKWTIRNRICVRSRTVHTSPYAQCVESIQ